MSKTMLVLFWVLWLLDLLAALFAHREFIMGVFGRYAAPNSKYIWLWIAILGAFLLILCGSLYLKSQGNGRMAVIVAAIPVALALPYLLWMGSVLLAGKSTNWR